MDYTEPYGTQFTAYTECTLQVDAWTLPTQRGPRYKDPFQDGLHSASSGFCSPDHWGTLDFIVYTGRLCIVTFVACLYACVVVAGTVVTITLSASVTSYFCFISSSWQWVLTFNILMSHV